MASSSDNGQGEDTGKPIPDYSPEARRRAAELVAHDPALGGIKPKSHRRRSLEIARRTASGTWNDGFVHAGNLAYITLFAIFPFFIFGAAVFSALGEDGQRAVAIDSVLRALPPSVSHAIAPDAHTVIDARSGWLLWRARVSRYGR